MKQLLRPLVLAALTLASCAASASSVTTATIYLNTPNGSNAADPANENSLLPSANFTVGATGINYRSELTGFTPATFLNNPVFSNLTNGFNPNGSLSSTELVFTGFLTLNAGSNSFVLGHDDGAVLSVTGIGTVLNVPGPSPYSLSPFNVNAPSAGDYAFTLYYAECCSAPADLTFAINDNIISGTTPEPSSLVLLATGVLGAATTMRRRMVR